MYFSPIALQCYFFCKGFDQSLTMSTYELQEKRLHEKTIITGKDKVSDQITIDELEKRTEEFLSRAKLSKPTEQNFVNSLRNELEREKIVNFASEAYPIVHEKVLEDAIDDLKKKNSTLETETAIKNLFDRLIKKRPITFYGITDHWKDRDGLTGNGKWNEKAMADPENYMTYEELKLSAKIQLSTETLLINDGGRFNKGACGVQGSFLEEAVYVGAVGARFEKSKVMEHQEMVTEEKDSTSSEPVGKKFFNVDKYKERMRITFETFLIEANARGVAANNKQVYCHVVGLGLGVWQLKGYQKQTEHFLSSFKDSLERLSGNNQIKNIGVIDFSYIDEKLSFEDVKCVKIKFSKRNPFEKLSNEESDMLVVAMFAWDGNSYVGNEYWEGHLTASGDPAAASCSFIPQLLNPDINKEKICGDNLRVATLDRGVINLQEYFRKSKI